MLANLPDAFAYHQVVTDKEGAPVNYIFLEINTAFNEMTGLKREKVIGKKVTEVHPDIKDSSFDWIGVYGRVALGGEAVRFEHYFEPAERWYDVSAYSDAPGYFATIFRNITERKQTEEAYRQSEEKYRQILENVTDVIWISDMNLETTYVSPSVEVMLGESVSEHLSKNLEQKLPPDSLEKIILLLQEEIEKDKDPASDKKRARLIEVEHYKADGSTLWVAMHISALRDDAGNITGLLGISTTGVIMKTR